MIRQVVEISEKPATVRLAGGCIEISSSGKVLHRAAPSEIGVLIIGTPVSSVSGAALTALAEAGAMVVTASADHLPSAMLLPLAGNYLQNEKFRIQAAAPKPLVKRMWQSVISAKLRNQGRLLLKLRGDDCGLETMSRQVCSGDAGNLEARGARIYWHELFNAPFARERGSPDNNCLLNYGYAILRAMAARAVCGAGLHPTLGINHHNRYNSFCLADDLMEPFRPLVDETVCRLNPANCAMTELPREYRRELIADLQTPISTAGGLWRPGDLLKKAAEATAESFISGKNRLAFD